MAPTHPTNIKFEFKVSRKTLLVTGNIVDFIWANMGQFSICLKQFPILFLNCIEIGIVVICVPYLCHSVLFVFVCSCSVVSVVWTLMC